MNMEKKAKGSRFLGWLEGACNKLPQPGILFMYLFWFTALLSLLLSKLNVTVINPATNETVTIQNFFSIDGLYWFIGNLITNFTSFPPLGMVLVMTVAVGLCEESGLIETLLNEKMKHTLPVLVPYVTAFIGIQGNIASDTASIIIPPMAGLFFLAAGRHPISGIICGYAAVQAGFTANIMVAGTDGLLQSITQQVVDDFLGEGALAVDITCNWYFMAASTFLCTFIIGFMTNHFVEKKFGTFVPVPGMEFTREKKVTPIEKKAFFWAGISMLIYVIVLAAVTIWGPLGIVVGFEAEGKRAFIGSYLLKYLVPVLLLFFGIPGIVYGVIAGAFKGIDDIYKTMIKITGKMSGYIVFCFFCAQFQKLFSWSNIDKVLAINGSNLLNATGFTGFGMIVVFILFSSFINIFITSASSKWAIMAPVFIPMMLMAGNYHPAMTQIFYRIGDSSTNCFTPMMPYIWVTLKNAQDTYDPEIKLGTFVSTLLPIGLVLLISWIVFLLIWMLLGIPVGPGVSVFIPV
jgi:aminobenzoyl-glutamate transport protein